MSSPRLCWYGDDFTGATDTLAVLTQGGLRAMLFLDVPSVQQRGAAARALGGELQAIGIAGATRSMRPDAMAHTLAPVGDFFAELGAPILHYKVCSTFDSAPEVGNVASAIAMLRQSTSNRFTAIVAGQPNLGRYCAFSNLFAAAGRGGPVERIDRHPTMRAHPVTPMREADLRRHLGLQGLQPLPAIHYPSYAQPQPQQDAALDELLQAQPPAVLFDVADASHLAPVGRLLWQRACQQSLLAVGPSSVAQALLAHWRSIEALPSARTADGFGPARSPVLVVAGSLSPVTARQVRTARSFEPVPATLDELMNEARRPALVAQLLASLREGRHVLACTAPADARDADAARAGEVAAATATLVREVLEGAERAGAPLQRLGIAGGDTSSLAVQGMGLWGLSCLGTLGDGVAVSRTHSDRAARDGMELMLKGGQMGAEDVFEQFLQGSPQPTTGTDLR